MMYLAQFLQSGLGLAIVVFLIIWAVLWFLVPFILAAINSKLKKANDQRQELIKIGNKTNLLLEKESK